MPSNIRRGLVTQNYLLTLVGEHIGGISAQIEIKSKKREREERGFGICNAAVTLLIFKVSVHMSCCRRVGGGGLRSLKGWQPVGL